LFLVAKDAAGRERAIGSEGFAVGHFDGDLLRDFIGMRSQQDAMIAASRSLMTAAARDSVIARLSGPAMDAIETFREMAMNSAKTGSTAGATPETWFKTATDRLALFHDAELDLAKILASDAAGAAAQVRREFVRLLVTSLILTSLALGIGFVLARELSSSIGRLVSAMARLAQGAFDSPIADTDLPNEIGTMARAVAVFKENGIKVQELTREQDEQKRRAEEGKQAALRELADSFELQVGGVIQTVSDATTRLETSATTLANGTIKTSVMATDVAAAAEQATSNVTTVASATEELSATSNEIARQMERSLAVATAASGAADNATTLIDSLAKDVASISAIADLINDIAGQTNLLALNATIEAARAGDAGKGFAVVANEVKNLANQTARATQEISAKISAIDSGTVKAVAAIQTVSGVIAEINQIGSTVAIAIHEQSEATTEIARNVDQAATGTREVSARISTVESFSRETSETAVQINHSATDLAQQAAFLRVEVAKFLSGVRGR
jgi:methyl-accepting chemotaxis protein